MRMSCFLIALLAVFQCIAQQNVFYIQLRLNTREGPLVKNLNIKSLEGTITCSSLSDGRYRLTTDMPIGRQLDLSIDQGDNYVFIDPTIFMVTVPEAKTKPITF